MSSAAPVLPRGLQPSAVLGSYPESLRDAPQWGERLWRRLARLVPLRDERRRRQARQFVAAVARQAEQLGRPDIAQIGREADALRQRFISEGLSDVLIARSFALVQAAAGRSLGMRHYDVQLVGGWVMMHGMLAEMQTGEGKTLTATLPACTAALAGIPVHLITVNDYLAQRDADTMRPLYDALGISVGTIREGLDNAARRDVYSRDVAYCTAKQLAFDYLRDRLVMSGRPDPLKLRLERIGTRGGRSDRLMLRGLCFAIVDEADSVLIDEARTPLLVAGPGTSEHNEQDFHDALGLARVLVAGRDFDVDEPGLRVSLTAAGRTRLAALTESLHGIWRGPRAREQLATQALAALHLFRRDLHYLVRDGKVQIIDQHTGRTMADRSWQGGLHQMIEAKEQCALSTPPQTLARISFQRLFQRYLRMAGMTGTAEEVAAELRGVYGLDVVDVPTHAPVQRTNLGCRIFLRTHTRSIAVLDSIRRHRDAGRPVLVGTRSVEESEQLSELLTRSGVPHQVLNARQNRAEADIVARAGTRARVTIATNMAGRGTDIPLGPGVAEAGGLHVVVTGRNEARRIDRQLIGRCARHGEPGSFEMCLSLEDALVRQYGHRSLVWLAGKLAGSRTCAAGWFGRLVQHLAQRRAERRHYRARRHLLDMDKRLEDALAFSGQSE